MMNWMRAALTVLAGGFVASLTDWLFMGDWPYLIPSFAFTSSAL